ncbi:hypothetical protein MBLNU230_g1035t1 [Neophaeotheca triangularis]
METTTTTTFDMAAKTKGATPAFETLPRESAYMQGYTSDEEAPSPIEDDDMSVHSIDSFDDAEIVEASTSALPSSKQQTTATGNSTQSRCTQAQTVTIVPAGRAKVVSMPKIVKTNSTSSESTTRRRSSLKPPVSRLSHMELAEYDTDDQSSNAKSSPRSSIDKATSTAPSSVAEQEEFPKSKSLRRQPSTLTLDAAYNNSPKRPTTSSGTTTISHRSMGLFKDDPNSPLEYSPPMPQSPKSTPPRKQPRQSTSFFNLSRFGLSRSNTTSKPASPTTPKSPQPPALSRDEPSPLSQLRPKTSSGSVRSKMIARGASYRAPVLELPPCPTDVDGDFDLRVRGGPTRKFSAPAEVLRQEQAKTGATGPKLLKKPRVVSMMPRATTGGV